MNFRSCTHFPGYNYSSLVPLIEVHLYKPKLHHLKCVYFAYHCMYIYQGALINVTYYWFRLMSLKLFFQGEEILLSQIHLVPH